MEPPKQGISLDDYENHNKRVNKMSSKRAEWNRNYASSSSIVGHLQQSNFTSTNYQPPNVDSMESVRRSLESSSNMSNVFPTGGPQSIWAAARETSQSLEFDIRPPPSSRSSNFNQPSYDTNSENVPQISNANRPSTNNHADMKNQIELERRLARLEAENEKLKKNQAVLLKQSSNVNDKTTSRRTSSNSNPASTSTHPPQRNNYTNTNDETTEVHESESEALNMIRKSVEKGLSALSGIDKNRQLKMGDAERRIKQNTKELNDMKKAANSYKKEAEDLQKMLTSGLTKNPTSSSSVKKVTISAPPQPQLQPQSNSKSKPKSPTKSSTLLSTSTSAPLIPTTRAAKLREEKRKAEREAANNTTHSNNSEDEDDGFITEKTKRMDWSFMGPPPADPFAIQRVDRHRDFGADLGDVSPRRSKDFDKMCGANTSVELKVEEGKPLDWSVLMGTNDRKKLIVSHAIHKSDPTFEEVKNIISHCRNADFPSLSVSALLPPPDQRLPPPKEPENNGHSFKKRLSKLFIGLKVILENQAEKQVKYVSFKQRCNLHTKDLESVLARRAIATMAYSYGAVNSSHVDATSFSTFLRAFWNDDPKQFPLYEGDLMLLWELCDAGDTALLSELIFVQPYIERNTFGFEFAQQCWGRPRDGILRCRSAGFDNPIDPEDVPAKVIYAYCKSTVMPPQNWDVNDIKRGMEVPKSQLELERVYGCLGKTICPNLYETYEGKVVFTAAAVAVVQHVESGAQRFYNNHTDDITCISIHYAGKLVVTGQLGKPCYCLVWSLETFETLFRIGDGYFERMVQAAAISPNERYLCGVGGDNSQSVGIFDLKAIDEATGQPSPVLVAESQFGPGVPPMMTFLEWKPGMPGVTFVGVASKSKLLKFFDFEPDNAAENLPVLSERKGIPPRDVRELPCAAWSMDGSVLVTGTDIGDVLIWTGVSVTFTIKAFSKVRSNFVSCTAAAFTPEGDKLYTGGSNGELKVWTYPDGEEVDVHNLALSRSELASKTGAGHAVPKKLRVKADKGIPGAPKTKPKKVEKKLENNKAVINIIVLDKKKVIKGDPQAYEQVVIMTEKGFLLNVWDDSNGDTQFRSLMSSHFGEVSGLGPHPFIEGQFATVGEDGLLNVWNATEKACVKTTELSHPARNCAYSPDGKWLAVGFCDGYLGIFHAETLVERSEVHFLTEDIDTLRFSPNGWWLATGSHDNYIDLIDCRGEKFCKVHRFKGHTSYITHLDFSTDSRMLMSNCGASEILYWDVQRKKQLRSKADMHMDPNDPKTWGRMTSVLGFPVMGIWPDFSDGTDVNALHVNTQGDMCVTADDFGEVKLFNFPCVVEDAAFRAYKGHSSFVNNVSFIAGDNHVVSCGSADMSVMQWKFVYDIDAFKGAKNVMKKLVVANAFSKGAILGLNKKKGGGGGLAGMMGKLGKK